MATTRTIPDIMPLIMTVRDAGRKQSGRVPVSSRGDRYRGAPSRKGSLHYFGRAKCDGTGLFIGPGCVMVIGSGYLFRGESGTSRPAVTEEAGDD